jgi:hypothetical protein
MEILRIDLNSLAVANFYSNMVSTLAVFDDTGSEWQYLHSAPDYFTDILFIDLIY